MGLAMALQEVADKSGQRRINSRLANSQAVIGDAQAFLEEFPLPEPGLDLAILEIRKAEIELIRLGAAHWFKRLRKVTQRFPKSVANQNWDMADLATGKAHLLDAFARLSRAEKILRLHRKSRWWWWLFATLKMKACEYMFVLHSGSVLTESECHYNCRYSPHAIPAFVWEYCRSGLKQLVDNHRCNEIFLLARITHSFNMTLCSIYGSSGESHAEDLDQYRGDQIATEGCHVLNCLLTRLKSELDKCDKTKVYPAVQRYATECHDKGIIALGKFENASLAKRQLLKKRVRQVETELALSTDSRGDVSSDFTVIESRKSPPGLDLDPTNRRSRREDI